MRREVLDYKIEIEDSGTVNVYLSNHIICKTLIGIESALEAIFVIENLTKKDWLLYEDGNVILVDRI